MDKNNKVERVNDEKGVVESKVQIRQLYQTALKTGTANALELGLELNEKQGQAA